ncbi:1-phosphatidylinositol 4,5-bisphosphate phosphodiesterase gamma-1 [Trichinella sp. T9]|nr:1-phosphatidylinositol 4,5-bisphosphate phosphodiesterase gamma-1 [Trichinella sp. T9]
MGRQLCSMRNRLCALCTVCVENLYCPNLAIVHPELEPIKSPVREIQLHYTFNGTPQSAPFAAIFFTRFENGQVRSGIAGGYLNWQIIFSVMMACSCFMLILFIYVNAQSAMEKCETADAAVNSIHTPEQQKNGLPRVYNSRKLISYMEKGTNVAKVFCARKLGSSFNFMRLQCSTMQLLLCKDGNNNNKDSGRPYGISLHFLKEAQTLEYKVNYMKVVDRNRHKDMLSYDPSRIMIVYFGSEFILQQLFVAFDSQSVCDLWTAGINAIRSELHLVSHPVLVDRWLRREFLAIAHQDSLIVPLKLMKPFIQQRLQCRIPSKSFLEIVNGNSNFEAFVLAYRRLVYRHSLFSCSFFSYSVDGEKVFLDGFRRFLLREQNDKMAECKEECRLFMCQYLRGIYPPRDEDNPYLTIQEFVDFLFSKQNSIFDPVHENITQSMWHPLCDYWIASSHNTYLTGDQLKSESSLEAYARALMMNCRCVELDCWDGQKRGLSELDIVIYHGYTMTTKLSLRDVLRTIKEYAFVQSEYPVILSVEDNCTLPYQRQLVKDLKEILGDMLLTFDNDPETDRLPSPEQLKGKIIVKHKKLPVEQDDVASGLNLNSFLDDPFRDTDALSNPDILKKGILYIKEKDLEEWHPHIFLLFPDRIYFTRNMDTTLGQRYNKTATVDENADKIEELKDTSSSSSSCEQDDIEEGKINFNADELHLTEEWFHGRISRDQAVEILKEHSHLGKGLFLVRESSTFVGDHSLSLLYNDTVHHCRIKSTQIAGTKHYYLVEAKKVDSLYQLIAYYQQNYLVTPKFRAKLKIPCPQPCPHIGEPWFHAELDRQKAEEMLNAYPLDGAFLIRTSSSGDRAFILSFRVDGHIKHCRLKQEGRLFVVCDHQFENFNWLVDYYGKNELYHGISLKYPVNAETIEKYASEVSHAPTGSYMDLNSDGKTIARARCNYVANNESELSFPMNAWITVQRIEDEQWLRGIYKGKVGLVPRDQVELIPSNLTKPLLQSDSNYNLQEFDSINLSTCSIEELDVSRPFVFSVRENASNDTVREIIVAANSRDDQIDWMNSILEVSRSLTEKANSVKTKEKCLRIARELSDIMVYCQAIPFNPGKIPGSHREMCSFSELKLERLLEKDLLRFNRHQLSRVYPNACRLTSSNFNPIPMWNAGCQMVALNYQTPDKFMQLNQARFLANGRCGYVLKPEFMRNESYDPNLSESILGSRAILLTIEVIAGRHLYRKDRCKGIVSPVVEVEIVGLPFDCQAYRTSVISCDGLHPIWNEHFEFNVKCPEAALLRFYVEDGDLVYPSGEPVIAQATFPLNCIRTGYRSVNLKNEYSEELELSALLLHIDIQQQEEVQLSEIPEHILEAIEKTKNKGTVTKSLPENSSSSNMTNRLESIASPSGVPKKKLSTTSIKRMFKMSLSKSASDRV